MESQDKESKLLLRPCLKDINHVYKLKIEILKIIGVVHCTWYQKQMNLKLKFGFHFEASEHNKNRLQYKTVKT